MAAADYRLLTEATGQRIAAALEALSGTGAAAAAARTNLDVYSKGETDTAIAQSTASAEANFRRFDLTSASTYTINVPSSMVFIMLVGSATLIRQFCGRIFTNGSGTMFIDNLLPLGEGLTIDASEANKIKLTIDSVAPLNVTLIGIRGDLRYITY